MDLLQIVDANKTLFDVKSAIGYFNEHGTNAYLISLDLPKAYDKVKHCKLWFKLYDAGVPFDILNMFAYWFQHVFYVVEWNNCRSRVFSMKNCVRQAA